jgi:hypothetical protein
MNLNNSPNDSALTALAVELERRRRAREKIAPASRWASDKGTYVNRETGNPYTPHHQGEIAFVEQDGPWRYGLAKGGEGGGKSVAGIIKTLQRLRRGMSGAMVSTDLEHFKKSLWPEFQRWCPWGNVVESQRRRGNKEWVPSTSFTLVFDNKATLLCGGIDDPESWEGPNLHFAHFDEARRKKEATALKVLDGRIRMTGPNGEPPQLFLTTTPRKHWLYDYFGPIKLDEHGQPDDERLAFKQSSFVIDLLTSGNAANLAPGFADVRKQSLTEAEIRVLLNAEWEDIDDTDRFLTSIIWWDACKEDLPALDPYTPMVLAADAGVDDDNFALIGVTRHPDNNERVAVRYARRWVPNGGKIDFDEVEAEIERLCSTFHIVMVTYDVYQLHQMMNGLLKRGVAYCDEFGQQKERLEADNDLRSLIMQKKIAHDGNPELRAHIDNADAKKDPLTRKLRMVKGRGKIDMAVATSMGAYKCLELNL